MGPKARLNVLINIMSTSKRENSSIHQEIMNMSGIIGVCCFATKYKSAENIQKKVFNLSLIFINYGKINNFVFKLLFITL